MHVGNRWPGGKQILDILRAGVGPTVSRVHTAKQGCKAYMGSTSGRLGSNIAAGGTMDTPNQL